jgi:hypothetical protein
LAKALGRIELDAASLLLTATSASNQEN